MNKLTGRSFTLFIEAQRSQATRDAYYYFLSKYMQFHSLKTNNTDSLLEYEVKIVQNQLIDYILHLKKTLRSSTIKSQISAVISFYLLNDVVLNSKLLFRYVIKQPILQNRAYTTEELGIMLQYCDERTKVIVTILSSCGCRLGALPNLRMQDLVPIQEHNLCQIWIYAGHNECYCSFISPEATLALQAYKSYRERSGELITPKSFVIRNEFDKEDPNSVQNVKPLTTRGYEELITDMIIKAGLRKRATTDGIGSGGKVRHGVKLMHGFRKHFSTCLSNCDVNELYKKLFMGHSVQLDESYYDKGNEKSRQKCLQEYLKGVDMLTINEENRLKVKLKKEHDEIYNIREQMQTMQESQNEILQFLKDPLAFTLDKQAYCAGPNISEIRDKALLEKLGIKKDEVLQQVMAEDGTFFGRVAKRQQSK